MRDAVSAAQFARWWSAWWADLPVREKGLVVVAIPLVALVCNFASSYVLNREQESAHYWIEHTALVSSRILALRNGVADLHAAFRSRHQDDGQAAAASYHVASFRLPRLVSTLTPLVKDNGGQMVRLHALNTLLERDLTLIERLLKYSPPAGPGASADAVEQALAQRQAALVSRIRVGLNTMEQEEERLMHARIDHLAWLQQLHSVIDPCALFLGLLGGMAAMLLFGNGIVRRLSRLQADTQRLADELPLEPWEDGGDEIGALAAGLAQASDLLVRRRREVEQETRRVRQSETLYRTLAHNYPNGSVFLFDGEMRYLVADGQGLLENGPARGALEGATLHEAFSPETANALEPLYRATLQGESVTGEIPYGERLYQVQTRPVRNEAGEVNAGLVVTQDITERKVAERELQEARREAERANRAKSDFLSRMSHELRTPLNAILGFGQLLEMGSLPARQRENVQHIIKGGRHLLTLVNEVLDLASIEAGRLSISLEPVQVFEVLREVMNLVGPLAQERRIRLDDQIEESCGSRYVMADRQRLRQAILNLLSNAVKYNREGGSVTVSCQVQPGDLYRFKVRDTGPGIKAEQLARLFNPFERLNPENTAIEGTGLGLALSRRLVELMGGTLGVESAPGEGSTFWIELPLAESPIERLERNGRSNDVAPAFGLAAQTATVLYIEDNESNLILMEQVFTERPGVRLLSTTEGSRGLERARQELPDLILLDLQLPGLTGDEVLARLRAEPATAGIPVVMISADATLVQSERLIAAGARAYLSKPFDIRDFLCLVDQILGATKPPERPALMSA